MTRGVRYVGREVPVSISIANLDLNGERYSVGVMREGGEIHSEITQVTAQAETDLLTGIGNRLRLSRTIQAALAASSPFDYMFLDLKKFKSFNDNHEHETGDKVLQIVAGRLQAQIRSEDLAARLGGDEFVVMLDGLDDIELLEQRVAKITRSLTRPVRLRKIVRALSMMPKPASLSKNRQNPGR